MENQLKYIPLLKLDENEIKYSTKSMTKGELHDILMEFHYIIKAGLLTQLVIGGYTKAQSPRLKKIKTIIEDN